MSTTSESLAFDRGVRPMLEIVLPEKADAVIGFRADPSTREIKRLGPAEPCDAYLTGLTVSSDRRTRPCLHRLQSSQRSESNRDRSRNKCGYSVVSPPTPRRGRIILNGRKSIWPARPPPAGGRSEC